MKGTNSLEFHRTRYAEEFVFDELRWSRIRPCLRMMEGEQRKRGRKLNVLDVGCGDGTVPGLFLEVRALHNSLEALTQEVLPSKRTFPSSETHVFGPWLVDKFNNPSGGASAKVVV